MHSDGALEDYEHKYDARDMLEWALNCYKRAKNWYVDGLGKDQQYSAANQQTKVASIQQLPKHHQGIQWVEASLGGSNIYQYLRP